MIVNQGHYRFDNRVFHDEGPVLDLGCLGWDWSKEFAHRKQVVGFDPIETHEPDWAELHRAAVGPYTGRAAFEKTAKRFDSRLTMAGEPSNMTVDVVAFADIVNEHQPSLVKMNIEGAEYPLLVACTHPICPQVVVSFHDFREHRWRDLTQAMLDWLGQWYDITLTCENWQWYVMTSKTHD